MRVPTDAYMSWCDVGVVCFDMQQWQTWRNVRLWHHFLRERTKEGVLVCGTKRDNGATSVVEEEVVKVRTALLSRTGLLL